jgi:predicted component of type VI protein secretion system
VFDPSKSISKTHLEFGQESGRFWVSDRFSTNGSVVRQPDADPKRCDPGKRYFIARGSRVDVGEQFFVVS